MIIALLSDDLTAHFGLPKVSVSSFAIETSNDYFELRDDNLDKVILSTTVGFGSARFRNLLLKEITIVNYDGLVSSVKSSTFQRGRKRCDLILSTSDNTCFIFGELKDRRPAKTVRREAKKQLLSSLQTLCEVPSISAYINCKMMRRCCCFNKQSSAPIPVNAPKIFNRINDLLPEGFKMSHPGIESHGFEFYEYTGNQTLVIP